MTVKDGINMYKENLIHEQDIYEYKSIHCKPFLSSFPLIINIYRRR